MRRRTSKVQLDETESLWQKMSYNVESTVSWHISAFGGKIWELEKGER